MTSKRNPDKIYLNQTGCEKVTHDGDRPSITSGWRETSPRKQKKVRIPVTFYIGFGWLSSHELFELRQKNPRNAP